MADSLNCNVALSSPLQRYIKSFAEISSAIQILLFYRQKWRLENQYQYAADIIRFIIICVCLRGYCFSLGAIMYSALEKQSDINVHYAFFQFDFW